LPLDADADPDDSLEIDVSLGNEFLISSPVPFSSSVALFLFDKCKHIRLEKIPASPEKFKAPLSRYSFMVWWMKMTLLVSLAGAPVGGISSALAHSGLLAVYSPSNLGSLCWLMCDSFSNLKLGTLIIQRCFL
jgi:hypothetical protein